MQPENVSKLITNNVYALPPGYVSADDLVAYKNMPEPIGKIFKYLFFCSPIASRNALPQHFTQLQDIIAYYNMNSQVGEMFKHCYKYKNKKDLKTIHYYAKAELDRLNKYTLDTENMKRMRMIIMICGDVLYGND